MTRPSTMRRFYPLAFVSDLIAIFRAVDPNKHPPPDSLPIWYQNMFTVTCTYLTNKYPAANSATGAILFEVQEMEVWLKTMRSLDVLKTYFDDRFDKLRTKHRDVVEDILTLVAVADYTAEPEMVAPLDVRIYTNGGCATGDILEGYDGATPLLVDLRTFGFAPMHHVYESISHTLKERDAQIIKCRYHSRGWITHIDTVQYNYPIYLVWLVVHPYAADHMSFYNFNVVSQYIRNDVVRAVVTNEQAKLFMDGQKECMTRGVSRKVWNAEKLKQGEILKVIVHRET